MWRILYNYYISVFDYFVSSSLFMVSAKKSEFSPATERANALCMGKRFSPVAALVRLRLFVLSMSI